MQLRSLDSDALITVCRYLLRPPTSPAAPSLNRIADLASVRLAVCSLFIGRPCLCRWVPKSRYHRQRVKTASGTRHQAESKSVDRNVGVRLTRLGYFYLPSIGKPGSVELALALAEWGPWLADKELNQGEREAELSIQDCPYWVGR